MPATTRKSLTPVDNKVDNGPPTTPGTKVRHLTEKLQSKETENEALRENMNNLVKALGKMEVAKTNAANLATTAATTQEKKGKKTNPVAPAKTAYKFWCEAQTKKDGDNMQQLWKEADPKVRETYAALAKADKARYESEMHAYEQEKTALELYREKQKQEAAMAFYEAHLEAEAAKAKAQEVEGKDKKKKAPKDPDAPKRCMSSYMFFAQDMRASVVSKNPEAKVTEISKILGEMWKTIDKKKAKKYEDMAAADKERYNKEKAEYDAKLKERKEEEERQLQERLAREKKEAMELMELQSIQCKPINVGNDDVSMISDISGSKVEKKKKKDPNAPKRALSAYNYFMSENRESIKSKMPENATNAELMAEIGKQWKALTDKKKQKYNKMASKDQDRYNKEMEAYKATGNNAK